MRLWNLLKENMQKTPEQIVCEGKAEMTYEELIVYAEHFSTQLKGEKCCAILCSSEMAAAMALLGCFAAEVTAVPLSYRYGHQHCQKIMDTIHPSALITDRNGTLEILSLDDRAYKEPEIRPALIMCTSGTTGIPKGVMLSEDNVIANVEDICDYFQIQAGDQILISRPLYHCAVLTGEYLTSLCKGVKIRFYSEKFNPKNLLELIATHKITVFGGTPTMLRVMATLNRWDNTSSLKTLCVSGECMDVLTGGYIAKAFPNTKIYHVYGLTEACPRVSYLPPHMFFSHADSVGVPLRSVHIKIVKENGEDAGVGETGVLWVKGNNVMLGYYNAPEYTQKVLVDDWLCTGDIAVKDQFGLLYIKGRSDDLIIRAGMNIYPQEIERSLRNDERVSDVLAYKIDNPRIGVEIGLKIVGTFSSCDEVRALCAALLPSYQMPTIIEIVDALPRNGSGKVIRR